LDPADAQPRASIREQEWTVSPAAEKDLEQLPQIRREQDPTVVGRLTLANREGALPCLHATNDVRDYGVGKAIENVPRLRTTLQAMIDRYLDVQQDILETFLDRGQLRQLTQPTLLPSGKRLPGLHLDQPRLLALMQALVRFSHLAAGDTFSTREIHPQTAEALGRPVSDYPHPGRCGPAPRAHQPAGYALPRRDRRPRPAGRRSGAESRMRAEHNEHKILVGARITV